MKIMNNKNVFWNFKGEKIKFYDLLDYKSDENINEILDEVDRFYPNIKELRKLQPKKKIKKDNKSFILRKLLLRQNKFRLLKSSSDNMILNYITKKKDKFNDYYKNNNNEDFILNSNIKNKEKNKTLLYLNKGKSNLLDKNIKKEIIINQKNLKQYENKLNNNIRKRNDCLNEEYYNINFYFSNSMIGKRIKKYSYIIDKINNLSNTSKNLNNSIKNIIKDISINNNNLLLFHKEEKRKNIINKYQNYISYDDYDIINKIKYKQYY